LNKFHFIFLSSIYQIKPRFKARLKSFHAKPIARLKPVILRKGIFFFSLFPSSLFWYAVTMTIQQTIEIPADRRVYFDLPRTIPAGAAKFKLIITPKRAAHPEPIAPVHICHTLDEVRSDAARKSAPEAREEFRRVMQETHGALEHSKAWGQDVDVVAEIRRMRDEWGDPWAEAEAHG
jgi:hypothetical protein